MKPWSSQLKKGESPVYLLHGDEGFLSRKALDWLREAVLKGIAEDFNLDRFDAQENLELGRILDAARTLPMMAPRRMVLVRNAEPIFKLKAAALKTLLRYIEEPDSSSCLVFHAMESVRKSSALYKRILKHGCVFASNPLKERQIPGWLLSRSQEQGRRLDPDAAHLLLEAVGTDLANLDAALERLSLFVEEEQIISAAHVEESIAFTRSRSVWDLSDAILNRNTVKVLEYSHQLLSQGENPLALLGLVLLQYRRLLMGRSYQAQGLNLAEICKQVRIPSFRSRDFGRQLNHYSGAELLEALERLNQADRALKSSKLPNELIFEGVLMDLSA